MFNPFRDGRGMQTGRRAGAVMLVDRDGKLAGLFTDGDLAITGSSAGKHPRYFN